MCSQWLLSGRWPSMGLSQRQPQVRLATERWTPWPPFRFSEVQFLLQFLPNTSVSQILNVSEIPMGHMYFAFLLCLFHLVYLCLHITLVTCVRSCNKIISKNIFALYSVCVILPQAVRSIGTEYHFSLLTMAHLCPVCNKTNKRILNHAYRLRCSACSVVSHMKCVTLAPDEQQFLRQYQNWWLCQSCLLSIFPFNIIVIDKEVIAAINCIDKASTLNDSDIIFHPFEINDTDQISPLCEINPDLQFYNSIDPYLSKCNYYEESSFAHIVSNMANLSQPISLCHLNIRSIKIKSIQFCNIYELS